MEPETDIPLKRKWTRGAIRALWGATVLMLVVVGAAIWYQRRPVAPVYSAKDVIPRANCIAFSPERGNKYIAAAFSDGRVRLWEAATRRELTVKLPSQWPLSDLAWSPDGGTVFAGGFEQHVLAFSIKSSRAGKLPKFPVPVVSIAMHPSQPEMLASLANGELWWQNLQTDERSSVATGHTGNVKVVRYHPDGRSFITGGADQQLVWHDTKTRTVTKTVAAHQHEISCIAFSPDQTRIASGSWDNTVKVWQADSGNAITTLTHPAGISGVDWLGLDVASSCWDGRLRIWTVSTSTITRERACHSDSLAFSVWPGRELIAEVDSAGTLHLEAP